METFFSLTINRVLTKSNESHSTFEHSNRQLLVYEKRLDSVLFLSESLSRRSYYGPKFVLELWQNIRIAYVISSHLRLISQFSWSRCKSHILPYFIFFVDSIGARRRTLDLFGWVQKRRHICGLDGCLSLSRCSNVLVQRQNGNSPSYRWF